MRFLVLGGNGQLGRELERALAPLGPVVALDRSQCDLADPRALPAVLRRYPADVLLNAAACNAVDLASRSRIWPERSTPRRPKCWRPTPAAQVKS